MARYKVDEEKWKGSQTFISEKGHDKGSLCCFPSWRTPQRNTTLSSIVHFIFFSPSLRRLRRRVVLLLPPPCLRKRPYPTPSLSSLHPARPSNMAEVCGCCFILCLQSFMQSAFDSCFGFFCPSKKSSSSSKSSKSSKGSKGSKGSSSDSESQGYLLFSSLLDLLFSFFSISKEFPWSFFLVIDASLSSQRRLLLLLSVWEKDEIEWMRQDRNILLIHL